MRPVVSLIFSSLVLAGCEKSPTAPSDNAGMRFGSLEAGSYGTCGLTLSGKLLCWGRTGVVSFSEADSIPQEVPGHLAITEFAVANGFGGAGVCAVTTSSATYCWGYYLDNDAAHSYGPPPFLLQDSLPLDKLAAGEGHMCGLASDGSAYCWGSTIAGKRGEGEPDTLELSNTILNRVAGGLQFSSLGAADHHTCGLTSAMTVYCWGYAPFLGDTLGTFYTGSECFLYPPCAWEPIPVRTLSSVRSLAVGGYQSCALLQSGAVTCWQGVGLNSATTGFPTPVALPESAQQVTVGAFFACALGMSGKVYCWGQPGPWRGTDAIGTVVEVSTGLRFASIAAGALHSCGIDRDGIAYCWGRNAQGQLGNHSHADSYQPVRVDGQG